MTGLQPPALNSSVSVIADWMELQTLYSERHQTRDTELIAIGQVEDDPEVSDSIEADSVLEELVDRVFTELDRREKSANGCYPFRLNSQGTALTRRTEEFSDGNYAYLFCLLVSEYRRHQMISRSAFDDAPGDVEDLFQVCSTVAAAGLVRGGAVSFGSPRPDGSGFLVALRRAFEEQMREGVTEHSPRPGVSSHTKDGGIDVIAWRDFPDGLPSKVYLLGQCASGATYPTKSVRQFLANLHGDWFRVAPASPPIEALFIPFMLDHDLTPRRSESITEARTGRYLSMARSLGVIVDRCRIAFLVELGIAVAQEKPGSVERASELIRVREWIDAVSIGISRSE